MSEVTEDCLSSEADLTTVNHHTNRMLQLVLQLTLFKVFMQTQSSYNVCNHHSVYTVLITTIIKYLDRKFASEK